ncbi:MAG: threonine synthase, partial [Bifidobacteriaceae bacterium]|nr:threonine synthase [Bifidobacteriaceae bacterium]
VPADLLAKIPSVFGAGWADEDQIRASIKDCWDKNHYVIDPHTACGYHTLAGTPRTPGVPRVLLSTASPYKFPRAVLEALGEPAPASDFACMDALAALSGTPAPTALRGLENAQVRFTDVIDVPDMTDYVRSTAVRMAE